MQHQLDHCPTRHLKRAALILIAVDIEPGLVLSSNPVFADVLLALDLHDRAQWQKRGTSCRVAPAANVRSRCGYARRVVRLPGTVLYPVTYVST
jgi:hypothetical protein